MEDVSLSLFGLFFLFVFPYFRLLTKPYVFPCSGWLAVKLKSTGLCWKIDAVKKMNRSPFPLVSPLISQIRPLLLMNMVTNSRQSFPELINDMV